MSSIRLIVNGLRYEGWRSARIVRTIDAMAGSFDLTVNDRWKGQQTSWPIAAEDSCVVTIDTETAVDGWIDRRSISIGATERSLSYSGRDRCSILADCSAVLDGWTFRRATVLEIATEVARPFGIDVSVQPGLILPPPIAKFVVSPGEKADRVILEAAQVAGVLAVSDGAGGLLLTRAGLGRAATPLVQGQNIMAMAMEYAADERFARYTVLTQVGGTDTASGAVTRVKAEVADPEVARVERALIIRPEKGVTADYAERRAAWEMRVRAARASTVTVLVHGWLQREGGSLWPVNGLVQVEAPAIGVRGELLITEAEHTIGENDAEVTQLRLVRPDAFSPEPTLQKARAFSGWAELAKGA